MQIIIRIYNSYSESLKMPYARIAIEDKQRLIDCHRRGEDYIELARNLGINRKTAYSIIARFNATGVVARVRGGNRRPRTDDEMRQEVVRIVEEHSEYTLNQINDELRIRLPNKPHISKSSLCALLDGQLITVKKLEDAPQQRNEDLIKERRQRYAQWLLQEGVNRILVYVDETGYNLHTKRTQGRAPRGERAVRVVAGQRGPNLTVCFAVSPQLGLVFHEMYEGGMTRVRFDAFLEQISQRLGNREAYVIIDNAPAHNAANLRNPHHDLIRLPAYSPFLNITEMANSAWKAAVKRSLAEHRDQLLGEVPPGMNRRQHRMASLAQIGEQNTNAITQHKCNQWYRHMQGYLPACINLQDILQ